MAEYFVNALGSETSPYDTRAKGMNTVKGLADDIGAFSDGDIISITDDDEIDDSVSASIQTDKSITLRSALDNTIMPTWNLNGAVENLVFTNGSPKIYGLKMRLPATPGLPVISFKSGNGGSIVSPEIIGNTIDGGDVEKDAISCIVPVTGSLKIYKNLIRDMTTAINLLTKGGVNNIDIRNNVIINVQNLISAVSVENFNFINNSAYGASGPSQYAIWIGTSLTNGKILNNIMQLISGEGVTGIYVVNYNSGTLDYNCIYQATVAYNVTGNISPGLRGLLVDPMYVNPDAGDLTLQTGSPCRNTGIGNDSYPEVPLDDYNDNPRGSVIVDMGAYQMDPVVALGPPEYPSSLNISTHFNRLHRVIRKIGPPGSFGPGMPAYFQARPGMWGNIKNGVLIPVATYTSKNCKMVAGFVNVTDYDSQDTKVGKVTCIEDFGIRMKLNDSVYVGQPEKGDFLTISAEQDDSQGKMMVADDDEKVIYAQVIDVSVAGRWIEIVTVSPYIPAVTPPPSGGALPMASDHYFNMRMRTTGIHVK